MINKNILKKILLVMFFWESWTLLILLFSEIGYVPTPGVKYLIAVVLGIVIGESVSRFSK